MKILVSACIMGVDCKYNGKNNKNLAAINYLKDKEIICICPEQLAGMATPRPCAEIVNGVVTDENGNDVDLEYKRAVSMALSKIQHEDIELAILQSRSPTCGVNQIYDGSFTGKLISGMGLFAKALKERGIKVIDVEEVESFNLLDFYRPKCVDRRYLFRWRSASFFRRTCTAQSGQYLARLELGVNAAPQTAQRLISSRPLVISAHRAASSGRTAILNHRHSNE